MDSASVWVREYFVYKSAFSKLIENADLIDGNITVLGKTQKPLEVLKSNQKIFKF